MQSLLTERVAFSETVEQRAKRVRKEWKRARWRCGRPLRTIVRLPNKALARAAIPFARSPPKLRFRFGSFAPMRPRLPVRWLTPRASSEPARRRSSRRRVSHIH